MENVVVIDDRHDEDYIYLSDSDEKKFNKSRLTKKRTARRGRTTALKSLVVKTDDVDHDDLNHPALDDASSRNFKYQWILELQQIDEGCGEYLQFTSLQIIYHAYQ